MELDATPALDPALERALGEALSDDADDQGASAYTSPWRRAGLQEGIERDEGDGEPVGYAFSPRSTRGATRA